MRRVLVVIMELHLLPLLLEQCKCSNQNIQKKILAHTSEEKVKFMKLAWDAIGSEFASRHTQYEMFYAGAQFVTRGHALRTYDWNRSKILVDDILNSYNLEDMFEEKNVAAE